MNKEVLKSKREILVLVILTILILGIFVLNINRANAIETTVKAGEENKDSSTDTNTQTDDTSTTLKGTVQGIVTTVKAGEEGGILDSIKSVFSGKTEKKTFKDIINDKVGIWKTPGLLDIPSIIGNFILGLWVGLMLLFASWLFNRLAGGRFSSFLSELISKHKGISFIMIVIVFTIIHSASPLLDKILFWPILLLGGIFGAILSACWILLLPGLIQAIIRKFKKPNLDDNQEGRKEAKSAAKGMDTLDQYNKARENLYKH